MDQLPDNIKRKIYSQLSNQNAKMFTSTNKYFKTIFKPLKTNTSINDIIFTKDSKNYELISPSEEDTNKTSYIQLEFVSNVKSSNITRSFLITGIFEITNNNFNLIFFKIKLGKNEFDNVPQFSYQTSSDQRYISISNISPDETNEIIVDNQLINPRVASKFKLNFCYFELIVESNKFLKEQKFSFKLDNESFSDKIKKYKGDTILSVDNYSGNKLELSLQEPPPAQNAPPAPHALQASQPHEVHINEVLDKLEKMQGLGGIFTTSEAQKFENPGQLDKAIAKKREKLLAQAAAQAQAPAPQAGGKKTKSKKPKIYTGPRGGKYILDKNNKKKYLK
jgi:hypothetical protein